MDSYWQILLRKWREKNRDGFSIPFIIGSQNYLPQLKKKYEIKDLILDIIDNTKFEVSLKYCMNIKEIVLEIRDESKKSNAGYFPNFKDVPQKKFFLTKFLYDLGDDVDSIIKSLEEKYNEVIQSGKYSKVNGINTEFTASEIKFIKECYKGLK